MRVQPEHEAAPAELCLGLLQLLRQVEHLACGVVRILTSEQTHSSGTIYRQKLDTRGPITTTNFSERQQICLGYTLCFGE